MPGVTISEVAADALPRYASVPIAFRVESVLRVVPADGGLDGLLLREEPVDPPYVKDYDADDPITEWPERFDVRHWGFLLACDGDEPVGAATVAFRSPDVHMLEGRRDVAVLWDIRVHPDRRGRGIGSALLRRAASWARERRCARLGIETQNVNVPACRFYSAVGARLRAVYRHAYAGDSRFADEAMLLWSLDL